MPGNTPVVFDSLSLPALLTLDETARVVGVHPRTLIRWAEAGAFPAPLRLGGGERPRIRYRREDVKRFLDAQGGVACS
jgi:excisionase family DNA binding protein